MQVKVLDHGFVELVESWGSDQRVIEAARMSTDKGFLGWGEGPCPDCDTAGRLDPKDKLFKTYDVDYRAALECKCKGSGKAIGDEKLLAYLWANKHATPFEMAGMTITVQAPIFVFREWHRHRTQSYNEMSARYTPLPDINYVPTVDRLMANSKTNKQAGTVKGAKELDWAASHVVRDRLRAMYESQEKLYQELLGWGVPKELARIHLPVGRYSRMMASTDLRNWLAFLTLRMVENAQWEIRQYANAVGELIAQLFPRTWQLFRPAI